MTYARFGGFCAIAAAIAGLAYAVAFVILDDDLLSGLFLLLSGLLVIAALTAAYERVRDAEPGFALLALGLVGYALGTLLVALYLARLIILDADDPVVVVLALLSGFLAAPVWYVWLGVELTRERFPTPPA